MLGVLVLVGVMVGVLVGVLVGLIEGVTDGVLVRVGVILGVLVLVGVIEIDGVTVLVGVLVGVTLGVFVGLTVGDGDAGGQHAVVSAEDTIVLFIPIPPKVPQYVELKVQSVDKVYVPSTEGSQPILVSDIKKKALTFVMRMDPGPDSTPLSITVVPFLILHVKVAEVTSQHESK